MWNKISERQHKKMNTLVLSSIVLLVLLQNVNSVTNVADLVTVAEHAVKMYFNIDHKEEITFPYMFLGYMDKTDNILKCVENITNMMDIFDPQLQNVKSKCGSAHKHITKTNDRINLQLWGAVWSQNCFVSRTENQNKKVYYQYNRRFEDFFVAYVLENKQLLQNQSHGRMIIYSNVKPCNYDANHDCEHNCIKVFQETVNDENVFTKKHLHIAQTSNKNSSREYGYINWYVEGKHDLYTNVSLNTSLHDILTSLNDYNINVKENVTASAILHTTNTEFESIVAKEDSSTSGYNESNTENRSENTKVNSSTRTETSGTTHHSESNTNNKSENAKENSSTSGHNDNNMESNSENATANASTNGHNKNNTEHIPENAKGNYSTSSPNDNNIDSKSEKATANASTSGHNKNNTESNPENAKGNSSTSGHNDNNMESNSDNATANANTNGYNKSDTKTNPENAKGNSSTRGQNESNVENKSKTSDGKLLGREDGSNAVLYVMLVVAFIVIALLIAIVRFQAKGLKKIKRDRRNLSDLFGDSKPLLEADEISGMGDGPESASSCFMFPDLMHEVKSEVKDVKRKVMNRKTD